MEMEHASTEKLSLQQSIFTICIVRDGKAASFYASFTSEFRNIS
jgi:hypothetical protein